ncbi:ParB/RepB/Spo0J family partition protein [Patescibacteria group bacterium]|nr:ParB/RepB/Spo0J family partition protein [Patescibacteria group bacterium]MBU1868249.1 ParB/RepB/Spo0J family partition protein [Patescibacteria group bacterium]
MEELVNLKINELAPNPMRPRVSFSHESLVKLSDSIRKYGVLEPIIVAVTPAGYQIICGERRWRAAKVAGLTDIPVIVKKVDAAEVLVLSLVENVQREDLTVFEQAAAIDRLQSQFRLSVQEIGEKLGLSVIDIEKRLKLLDLSDKVKNEILSRKISEREALELISKETEKEMYQEVLKKPNSSF